jgi:hypothetical protein
MSPFCSNKKQRKTMFREKNAEKRDKESNREKNVK